MNRADHRDINHVQRVASILLFSIVFLSSSFVTKQKLVFHWNIAFSIALNNDTIIIHEVLKAASECSIQFCKFCTYVEFGTMYNLTAWQNNHSK